MDVIFKKDLMRQKPNGELQFWSIRVESSGSGRGAFIITEQKPRRDAPVVARKKPVLKGKRMRSARPVFPDELAVSEANSRVIKKLDEGFALRATNQSGAGATV